MAAAGDEWFFPLWRYPNMDPDIGCDSKSWIHSSKLEAFRPQIAICGYPAPILLTRIPLVWWYSLASYMIPRKAWVLSPLSTVTFLGSTFGFVWKSAKISWFIIVFIQSSFLFSKFRVSPPLDNPPYCWLYSSVISLPKTIKWWVQSSLIPILVPVDGSVTVLP